MCSRYAHLGLLAFGLSGVGEQASKKSCKTARKLTRDDILAALAYGAEMSRSRFVDLPGQSAA